jgi:cysteinyl-tRNA synthetase
LIEVRKQAKAQKDWVLADMVRSRLTALDIRLVDQKDGSTTWERARQVPVS